MKERPILFSAPMVRAILDGRKTQTRRVMRTNHVGYKSFHQWDGEPFRRAMMRCANETAPGNSVFCEDNRYGVPGDRLWVRETFNVARPLRDSEGIVDDEQVYSGPLRTDPRGRLLDDWCVGYAANGGEGVMRPSIHMPRWASRITLEITDVRVERLQDISEGDAQAEGVTPLPDLEDCLSDGTHRTAYEHLWGQINGYDGQPKARAPWSRNPWVWVLSFRRVKP